jgi:hypothetical protein
MEPEGSLPNSQELSTCPYPEPDQSSPHHLIPTYQRSILILSTHQCLDLPSCLFLSSFFTNNIYVFLFSPIRVTCPAYLIPFRLIILIILDEEYKSRSSSLCCLFYSPVTSSLLGPNNLLRTLFSNIPSLCFSFTIV